eukprot:11776879-Heterocapsa_arctica.AAC.1
MIPKQTMFRAKLFIIIVEVSFQHCLFWMVHNPHLFSLYQMMDMLFRQNTLMWTGDSKLIFLINILCGLH